MHMWVQERVRLRELHVARVPAGENTAGIGTRDLDAENIDKLLRFAGLRLCRGAIASGSGGSGSG